MHILEAVAAVQEKTNFQKWFGKSVLHTNGVPHTFYHGTGSDIEKFLMTIQEKELIN